MKGDFTRNTYSRDNHYSRVLMQQGRVQLDADWNEQTSILLHYLRTLAADIIGPHGGPGDSFKIMCDDGHKCDFIIGRGHYYVDGILCENKPHLQCPPGDETLWLMYNNQPDYPLKEEDEAKLGESTDYLVYLDVWERHLTYLNAAHIREVALGGPDTTTRAQVVWQVKVADESECETENRSCTELLEELVKRAAHPCLRARARVEALSDDPCIIPPEANYRGAENQLYRVEIHDGGEVGTTKDGTTFKWSRDNGSVAFAIRSLQGSIATLETLGPDDRHGLEEGDWVEIVDDYSELRFEPRKLVKVEAVDRVSFSVTLAVLDEVELPVFDEDSTTHPLLRRWDQGSDVLAVQDGKWIDLEDGVQVYFETGGAYRTGDYWLIPARTAIGDVLWPTEEIPNGASAPQALPPHGIEHHYAPLARISVADGGIVSCVDCRCIFDVLCEAAGASDSDTPSEENALGRIYFDTNTSEFGDQASEAMGKNIKALAEAPTLSARIEGYALVDEDNPVELSEKRARSVGAFYVENGIEAERIVMVGMGQPVGTDNPAAFTGVDTILIKKVEGKDTSRLENQPGFETKKTTGDVAKPVGPLEKIRRVSEITGVGRKFAEVLSKANITDAAEVARMESATLAAILKIPTSRAETIIENANKLFEINP